MMNRLFLRCFTLDLRSLALLRICIALVILADLLIRLSVLADFHCDSGFFPRAEVQRTQFVVSSISIHFFTGKVWGTTLLFLFHVMVAISVAVGYRTQLSTALCWFLSNSLQTRNPFILDSGDRLYLLILMWGFFCHWGTYYSWDARNKPPPESPLICNLGTVGLLVQLCSLYWYSCIYKWHPSWYGEATALYIAMNLELFCRDIAKWVLPYWELLRWSTRFTMFAEIAGPLMILSGLSAWRFFGTFILMLLHLGIFILMSIGVFPLVSMSYLVAFLPSRFWEFLGQLKAKSPRFLNGDGEWQDSKDAYRLGRRDYVPLALVTLVFWWNLARYLGFGMPLPAYHLCNTLKVDQYWNLFAPMPRTLDCWFLVHGVTESGKEVNLWKPEAETFTWEKPKSVAGTFRCHRDRVCGTSLENVTGDRIRKNYLEVKARRYNEAHSDDPITYMRFYRMEQLTALGYRWVKPKPVVLFETAITPAELD